MNARFEMAGRGLIQVCTNASVCKNNDLPVSDTRINPVDSSWWPDCAFIRTECLLLHHKCASVFRKRDVNKTKRKWTDELQEEVMDKFVMMLIAFREDGQQM